MIKVENCEVVGWGHAIRGMRNPMNSWDKSDSKWVFYGDPDMHLDELDMEYDYVFMVGPDDHKLMRKLANAGTDHRKFMRMLAVYLDITAPLYWWKEFDTYKVGTVANSCSTMHKIHAKEFTLDDFSCEHLIFDTTIPDSPLEIMENTIATLNRYRDLYLQTKDKQYWWQMIQLLPSSYNQRRTVMLNYEVLANMYGSRRTHKLDEWRAFCEWMETLPYSELITGTALGRFPWDKSDEKLEKKVDELAEKAKENDTSVQIELEEVVDSIARAVRAGVSEDMIPLSMEDMKRLME